MPGFTEEALTWRKRKRENEDSLPRQTPFVPFLDHSTCDPYIPRHHDLEDRDRDRGDKELHWSSRPRCLPRKRRLLHSHNHNHNHNHQHQPQYLLSTTPHTQSLLSPNIYSNSRALDPYSPPVSPKTLIPLSCPTSTTTTGAPTSAGAGTATPSALRPCHICHRRPTTRALLDAYADCDLCAERACYICLRLCDGESCPGAAAKTNTANLGSAGADPYAYGQDENTSSRRKICSSCAVEGIADGVEIVRCLDCVRPWWGLDGDQMVEGN